MDATTVTELIARAVAAADMNDNFVSTAQWIYWANTANRELAVKVAQLGVPYGLYETTINLTGATTYAISEPLAIVAVYFVQSDGTYKRLKGINPVQKRFVSTTSTGDPRQFHVRATPSTGEVEFKFFPNPTSGSVIVLGITYPAVLVNGSSSVYYPLNWEEYIVLRMAQNALSKEETLNPGIERQMERIEQHIESSASNYLMTDLPSIRDLDKDDWDTTWIWPI